MIGKPYQYRRYWDLSPGNAVYGASRMQLKRSATITVNGRLKKRLTAQWLGNKETKLNGFVPAARLVSSLCTPRLVMTESDLHLGIIVAKFSAGFIAGKSKRRFIPAVLRFISKMNWLLGEQKVIGLWKDAPRRKSCAISDHKGRGPNKRSDRIEMGWRGALEFIFVPRTIADQRMRIWLFKEGGQD